MKKMEDKINLLIKEIPDIFGEKYKDSRNKALRRGPDLYFYKKTLSLFEDGKNKVEDLFRNEKFIESIYATLAAWGMNARGAKMIYFDDFLKRIKEKMIL